MGDRSWEHPSPTFKIQFGDKIIVKNFRDFEFKQVKKNQIETNYIANSTNLATFQPFIFFRKIIYS